MTRYFETFYNAEPMDELSEAEARAAGSYTVEDDAAMRRYRRIRELSTEARAALAQPD